MALKISLLLLAIVLIVNRASINSDQVSADNTTLDLNDTDKLELKYLPFIAFIDKEKDNSEYWRETEILSLVRSKEMGIDYEKCEHTRPVSSLVHIPSRRSVRPICKGQLDYQVCPQCPHFNNHTECELFRDSCSPELDQSCVEDEYNFDTEEFLPVTTIDFRAGCNPYWGHPEQELRSLKCDKILRRCVPVSIPTIPMETLNIRRSYRYQAPTDGSECPVSCRGFNCEPLAREDQCAAGAFLPDKSTCNCCGRCSAYQQLNQKCAEYKKKIHEENGTKEIEVEEEFLEPGCDDGLVCRQGKCQDIHVVQSADGGRRKRDENMDNAHEPCKRELKYFKKKYGHDGHLHFDAPQCTPLWLYAPVQCRKFVCYCALEDGTIIQGIKVPRVEVSNMNCDCAREKCRTGSDVECDGYGNYKEAIFTYRDNDWTEFKKLNEGYIVTPRRVGREIDLVSPPAQVI
ncbi:unnamed protein product [Chilo suppressalis]|uniref:Thyroglobulin type-1 domain-containing protein n=1 Tax=Chilo suppressalis TaxID=168631 RepID=A0ABN8B4Z4_CHISP|nr:unnamed protein product [Chilo suppressalis]